MVLNELVLFTQMMIGSPDGAADCCEFSQTKERYTPSKEIPYQKVEKVDRNTYAIREEDLPDIGYTREILLEPRINPNYSEEIGEIQTKPVANRKGDRFYNSLGRNEPTTRFINREKTPKNNLKSIPTIKKKSPLKMWANRNKTKI